jgi:hypothetical protein
MGRYVGIVSIAGSNDFTACTGSIANNDIITVIAARFGSTTNTGSIGGIADNVSIVASIQIRFLVNISTASTMGTGNKNTISTACLTKIFRNVVVIRNSGSSSSANIHGGYSNAATIAECNGDIAVSCAYHIDLLILLADFMYNNFASIQENYKE